VRLSSATTPRTTTDRPIVIAVPQRATEVHVVERAGQRPDGVKLTLERHAGLEPASRAHVDGRRFQLERMKTEIGDPRCRPRPCL